MTHQVKEQPDFSEFVGKVWEVNVTEEQVKEFCGANTIRVLYPNSPMTMDIRPKRVNIFVEQDKTIIMMNMG